MNHLRATVVALACSLATSPLPATAAEPFSATFSGHANPTPSARCEWSNHETGSGTSTLGAFAWVASETADFCDTPGKIVVNGVFGLDFATGSLAGTYQTTGELLIPQGRLYFEGTYEFSPLGSTGAFAGYSGSGTITAHADGPPEWRFVASMQGQVSSPDRS